MELGSWLISKRGKLFRPGRIINNAPWIFHLDDHQMLKMGMWEGIIKPFFPGARYTTVDDGDEAFKELENCYQNFNVPDVIFTDILHPGLDGRKFVLAIRRLEKRLNWPKPVPIIIFSFVSNEFPELENVERLQRFNKCDGINDLAEAIEYALYGEGFR